jgi:predicted kinase
LVYRAAGKSTLAAQIAKNLNQPVILSTDTHIERMAEEAGTTYTEIFKDSIKTATQLLHSDLARAIADERDIIWDQTNLTRKSRSEKLTRIPQTYLRVAHLVLLNENTLYDRLRARNEASGKYIPPALITAFNQQFQLPCKTCEDFDDIKIHIG